MVCAPFEYLRVSGYDEAVHALAEHGEEAKLLAGGQSLGPMLALRLARPGVLIDINDIDDGQPSLDDGFLHVPALTRHATLIRSPLISRHVPLLGAVASQVGNVRVRNRGTMGGTMAHADPTAEIPCASLALDAEVVVHGQGGERTVAARDFFLTYLTTVLEPTEVVRAVRFPVLRPRQGWSFAEMVRRASDFAVVAVAASVQLDPDGDTIRTADLALAGVADRPVLGEREALASLTGTTGAQERIASVAKAVAEATSPESDVHASGSYRRRLVEVLTRRTLTEAVERARRNGGAVR